MSVHGAHQGQLFSDDFTSTYFSWSVFNSQKKRKHLSATPLRLTMKIIFARYMDPIFRSQRNFLWIPLDTFDGLKTGTTWLKLLILFLLRYLYS